MVALVEAIMAVVQIFWDFVVTNLIPATASDLNIIHIATWVPVLLGLVTLTIGTVRGFWKRGGKRA